MVHVRWYNTTKMEETLTHTHTCIQCCRNLKELAKDDEELAELIMASQGDPEKLEAKMRQEMDAFQSRLMMESGGGGNGEEMPPKIEFRNADPFEVWVWIELYGPPAGGTGEMLQEVINSWFMLGRLGAYDSSNLQVLYSDGTQGFEYDDQHDTTSLQSTMHDMGEIEYRGNWARFWVDMGTSDELAFDILINALKTYSREHVGIRQILFGGDLEDWKLPEQDVPFVSMDPSGEIL